MNEPEDIEVVPSKECEGVWKVKINGIVKNDVTWTYRKGAEDFRDQWIAGIKWSKAVQAAKKLG